MLVPGARQSLRTDSVACSGILVLTSGPRLCIANGRDATGRWCRGPNSYEAV